MTIMPKRNKIAQKIADSLNPNTVRPGPKTKSPFNPAMQAMYQRDIQLNNPANSLLGGTSG